MLKEVFFRKRSTGLLFVLLFLISSFLTFIWFKNGNIMASGESGLLFYNLNRYFHLSKYTWTDLSLGNSIGIGVATLPTYWFLSELQNLGTPTYIIQAIFFELGLVTAGVGVFFLTREFFPKIRTKYLFLAI